MEAAAKKRRTKGEGSEFQARKKARNSGEAYVTKKNIVVAAKKPPNEGISCKCKYNCKKITHEHKTKLFEDFYALGNNEQQSSYLMRLIHIAKVKRRRHGTYDDEEESRRQVTVYFTVPSGDGDILQMCRKTFQEVFGITHRKAQTLSEKKKQGQVVYEEKRGKKKKFRKYTEQDEIVVDHVNLIPREVSHYSRNRSDRQYLSPDLNINRLYRAFKEMYPEKNYITYRFYYHTFRKRFPDLSFKPPKTDTCSTCDLLSTKIKGNPTNKNDLERQLELHHRKAERAIKTMKADHIASQLPGSSMCTSSMDLQQVLFLPTLTHTQMFYLRQLSNYNLGIHIGDTNAAFMHLWHEGISGRGGSEIASCALKMFTSSAITKKRLTIWTDNCCGQNKNKMMFLWVFLVSKGIFDEVHHKFLISGHSFLSCDRDFAMIEKQKRVSKSFISLDLVRMIETAKEVQPFVVNLMQKNDFYDFKVSNCFLNTGKLNISKAHWIKIDKETLGKVHMRETINDLEPWKTVNILKRGVTLQQLKNLELPPLTSVSRITEDKKQNLSDMIDYLSDPDHKRFSQEVISDVEDA